MTVGNIQMAQGKFREARISYERGLAVMKDFAGSHPDDTNIQHELAMSYHKVAEADRKSDDPDAAMTALKGGQAIMAHLMQLLPENATWKPDLAWFDAQISDLSR
jgi:hypothetical protein